METMIVYRCPNCGGEIKFDSDKQKLACPYCDSVFEIATLKEYQKQYQEIKEDEMAWDEIADHDVFSDDSISVYSCENCGGEIIGNSQTVATTCPYCNSPVIMNKNVSNQLKPDYVIPFKLDKEDAKAKLQEFFKGKPFLPKTFKTNSTLDEIKGIYVPFWIYNCTADVKQQYRATKTRHYSDSRYDYTETKYYSLIREGNIEFNNVPVDGSSKIDDEFMQSIEPFDFNEAVDFDSAYLAGYLADRYDENSKVSESKANSRIRNSTNTIFKNCISGYDHKILENSSIELKNKKITYYFLPVCILNLSWDDKIYPLMMNGQTGKLIGDLPADKKEFWKVVARNTIIITLVIFVIYNL